MKNRFKIYISSLLSALLLILGNDLQAQCMRVYDFCEGDNVEVQISGNNQNYTTLFVLVNSSTGLVMGTSLSGNFSNIVVPGTSYQVYVLNYNQFDAPNPLPAIGNPPASFGTIHQGCYNSDYLQRYSCINYYAKPVVSPISPLCSNAVPYQMAATPTGGVWSGANITSGGLFDPQAAGVGLHVVTYTHSAAQCESTYIIQVVSVPGIAIEAHPTMCITDGSMQLDATPVGGVWSGASNSTGLVTPASLGVGAFSATYTYTNSYGCSSSSSVPFNVTNCACLRDTTYCEGSTVVNTVTNATPVGYVALYALVDQTSGNVVAVNSNGDFTNDVITGHSYRVHYMNYNALNPPNPLPRPGFPPSSIGNLNHGCYNEEYLVNYICFNVEANPVIIAGQGNRTCSRSAANWQIQLQQSIPGVTYSWSAPVVTGGMTGGTSALNGNGLITDIFSNTTGVDQTATYQVTVTTPGGCSDVETVAITVTPVHDLGTMPVSYIVCVGQPVTFEWTTQAEFAGAVYQWAGPNTFTSNLMEPSIASTNVTHAGTYHLTYSLNGCTATATTELIVNPSPGSITFNTNSPVCEGQTLNISVASYTDPGTTYAWEAPVGIPTANSATLTYPNATSAHAGLYSVTVTTGAGCSIKGIVSIEVNTNPTVTLSSNTPLCGAAGNTLTLTANASGGGSNYIYSWVGPNNFTAVGSTINFPNASSTENGVYTVSVVDNNGCAALPQSLGVSITDTPVQPTISANSPVCEGGAALITIPSYSGNLVTYSWTFNGAPVINNSYFLGITNVDLSDAGDYQVTVSVDGCQAVSQPFRLVVNQAPSVTVTNNSPICGGAGNTLVLTAMAASSGTVFQYLWSGSNNFTASGSMVTIPNVNAAHNGIYTVSVTDNNGCTTVPVSTSVSILNSPTQPLISGNGPLCEGANVLLSIPAYTGNTVSYSWALNGNPLASNSNVVGIPNVTLANAGTYVVTVTVDGCTAVSLPYNLVVNTSPSVTVTNNSPFCGGIGVPLILDAQVSGGSSNYTYAWGGPGGFSANTGQVSIPNTSVSNAGIYTVLVTDSNGCSSTVGSTSVTITSSPDQPLVSLFGIPCEGNDLQLSAGTYVGNSVSFDWAFNGTSLAVNSNILSLNNVSVANNGGYTITVTVDGCPAVSAPFNLVVNPRPVITALTGGGVFCQGDTTMLTATVASPSGATFSWSGPGISFQNLPTSDLFLPNLQVSNTGSYRLTADLNGCQSIPLDVLVSVSPRPSAPIISSNSPLCVGSNLVISANAQTGNNVMYIWYFNGTALDTTLTASLTISGATMANQGVYNMMVEVDGCQSVLSTDLNVVINPIPVTSATSNTPLCVGQTLLLSSPLVSNTSYHWSGPSNFTSSLHNPSITNVGLANAGVYNLYIRDNLTGCSSTLTNVTVTVNELPNEPTLTSNSPICFGSNLNLSVISGATPGATYSWYNSTTNNLAGVSNLPNGLLTLGGLAAGSHTFHVVVSNVNNCSLTSAQQVTIQVFPTPQDVAFAGVDQNVCGGISVALNASSPSVGSGFWTSLGVATVANPTSQSSSVNNLQPGVNRFVWTLSNGPCTNYSSDTVVINVSPVSNEVAIAGPDVLLCNGNTANLSATSPTGAGIVGRWVQPANQAGTGVVISSPNVAATSVTGISGANTYTFIWVLNNGACGDFARDTVRVVNSIIPNETAFAGQNVVVCNGDFAALSANQPSIGTGRWSQLPSQATAGVLIASPNNANTVVDNLLNTNTFYWSLSNGGCLDYSVDSVVVLTASGLSSSAVDDSYNVNYDTISFGFNILTNDLLPTSSAFSVTILSNPSGGTLTDLGNGNFNYVPNGGYFGTDVFTYRVCSNECSQICDTATVTLRVGFTGECYAPNTFTPNNDNINDRFVVPCAINHPNNELVIFNRWGDEVYNTRGYVNDWEGTFNGEPLPEGTYFYIINMNDPLGTTLQGYVVIHR